MGPKKCFRGAAFPISLAVLLASGEAAPRPGAAPEEAPGPDGRRPAGPRTGGEIELPPRAEGKSRPLQLTAGEIHLIILLQALADSTGMKVVLAGGVDHEKETVRLTKAIPEPDRPSISAALGLAGYSVSEENFRGGKVLWITRELKPSPRRGTIIRDGVKEDSPPPGQPTRAASREAGAVRVFREGEGAGGSWLVILETTSRAEAEEASSLLRSYLQSRDSRRTGEPVPGARGQEKGKR